MREERKRLVWSSFALARYGGHHPSLFWLAEPKLTRALGKPERRMVAPTIPSWNQVNAFRRDMDGLRHTLEKRCDFRPFSGS